MSVPKKSYSLVEGVGVGSLGLGLGCFGGVLGISGFFLAGAGAGPVGCRLSCFGSRGRAGGGWGEG